MLLFVLDALVVDQGFVHTIDDDWFFQVAEEAFDKTGDEVRVLDLLQVLIVPPAQFANGLVFFVDRDALPEDALFVKSFGLGAEVVDQQLDYHRHSDVSHFVVLERVDFFGDEGTDGLLKLAFFFLLLLCQILTYKVDSVT